MPVILEELQRTRFSNKRTFRIGEADSGALESLDDLDAAIELVSTGVFTHTVRSGTWVLQRYINDQRGYPVRVSVISSPHVNTLEEFRESGVDLLQKAVAALEHGSITLAESGSDADIQLDPFDLAVLHDAFEKGETRGHFTLVGLVL
jgi:hypothetical protein